MQKEELPIMKVMAISFFLILFLISLSSAIDFTLESPAIADKEEEFEVKIISQEYLPHDVKIFVYKDTKEFSEILVDKEWKSTRYYIISSFPEQKEYKLISHYAGKTKLCARLRETGKSSFLEVCKDIEIKENSSPNSNTIQQVQSNSEDEAEEQDIEEKDDDKDKDENEREDEDDNEKEEGKLENNLVNLNNSNSNIKKISSTNNIMNDNYENKKIVLTKNKTAQVFYTTKDGKKPLLLIFSFTTFTIIIIILLALRKL